MNLKTLLLTILIFVFAGNFGVLANEEPVLVDDSVLYTEKYLPKTYIEPEVSLFGADSEYEILLKLEKRLVKAWENMEEEIDISDLDIPVEYYGLYWDVYHRNPEYYYVGYIENTPGGSYYYVPASYYPTTGTLACFRPIYTATKKQANEFKKELERETQNILMLVDGDMSDFEKVMTVHDYMVLNYEYDYSTSARHDISIMTTNKGVCESYTFAFSYIMNKLGIENAYVSAPAILHAWNLVKVDGEWYHIDLTWDDPGAYAMAYHTFALLSSDRMSSVPAPGNKYHVDFDEAYPYATSTRFDNAEWHDSTSAIVALNGKEYYVLGNNLVCSDGRVIYKKLTGSDGKWQISAQGHYFNTAYAGVAEHNDLIYFNTDSAICYYNPVTNICKKYGNDSGNIKYTCGIFINKNELYYSKFDFDKNNFVPCGSIHLGNIKYGHPYYDMGKLHAWLFNESHKTIRVFSKCGNNHIQEYDVFDDGAEEIVFETDDTDQTLYVWDENLTPLHDIYEAKH